MAKSDTEVRRSETNEGGVHTVREERTTTVKAGAPRTTSSSSSIPSADKSSSSSLTYLIPIALAIILAVALLSMRGGKITNEPRTWQDSITDSIQDIQDQVGSIFGFDTSSSSATAKYAKAKASDAAASAKAKAQEAAAKAKKQGKVSHAHHHHHTTHSQPGLLHLTSPRISHSPRLCPPLSLLLLLLCAVSRMRMPPRPSWAMLPSRSRTS